MKTAVIIGGGPAGCQCALWLKMLGYDPLIVEQHQKLGGLQAESPYQNNWMVGTLHLNGIQFAEKIERHIKEMQIEFLTHTSIISYKPNLNGFLLQSNRGAIEAKYIVFATGVKPRCGTLSNTTSVIIGPGQRVFDYDFTNKRVAILGGGDNAFENYSFVLNKKAKVCHIYARTIRARKNLYEEVNKNDIFFSPYAVDQQSMIISHQQKTEKYDVILVFYGWEANFPSAFDAIKGKLFNDQGFISTDDHCQTSLEQIYAIGEVTNRMHPCVITAMADGVVAAKAIQEREEHEQA